VIVVSKQIASVIPGDVIPCGVDLEVFKPRNQAEARAYLGLPEKRRIILFPFDPRRKIKRYDLARAAIDRLASNGHDIELLVVNGVKNDLMPFYYNAVDALILCSDSEGSPTTVKEALACNIPVICTNVGDLDELARKIPGIYICNKDEEALARKIDYVLCNENNVNFDGYSAMRPYEQGHLAMSIISVYERVLIKGNRIM
jgi:glycosyltransferase involved in cell wall biosynthesis